ncbi:MAG: guanylate kinase [Dehalococcoidia bacterium]|nr:guanylate kinase [Dehalococcoidia bacterium]
MFRPRSLFIVLSGPSGVGKDAVLARMKQRQYKFRYMITATTRPRRNAEKDGVEYYFLSLHEFQSMIDNGQLLEWANVYGNYYGVPKQQAVDALAEGADVVLKVDVQGAATIRKIMPQAVLIFLLPPSMKELRSRLEQRHSESREDMSLRLRKVREEMERLSMFDYAIVNYQDKLDHVVAQIQAIVVAEKCKVQSQDEIKL